MDYTSFHFNGEYFYKSTKGYYYMIKQFPDTSSKITRISKSLYQELKQIKQGYKD